MQIVVHIEHAPSAARTRDLVVWLIHTATSLCYIVIVGWTLRLKNGRFSMPPRLALSLIWKTLRVLWVAFVLAPIITAVFNMAFLGLPLFERCEEPLSTLGNATDNVRSAGTCIAELADQAAPISLFVVGTWWLLLILLTSPTNRRRLLNEIGSRLIGSDEEQAALTIASMLPHSKASAGTTIAIAKESFRALPHTVLTVDDFATSNDTGLHEKTVAAEPGSVSAFLSHSWRDPARPKFAALTIWIEQYIHSQHTAPTLWLDKVAHALNPAHCLCAPSRRPNAGHRVFVFAGMYRSD